MEHVIIGALVGALGFLVAGLILAERRASVRGMWATKPAASAAFVAIALTGGLPTTPSASLLFAAILLCFVGDLFLIQRTARVFRVGILAFLAAHVAFVGAFLAIGVAWTWIALALLPLAANALLVARWILPRVAATLKRAVVAYIVVITLMVAVGAGTLGAGATPLLLLASSAFYMNDLLVARDRFVARSWLNRLAGLPLYYGAMVLFALQVA